MKKILSNEQTHDRGTFQVAVEEINDRGCHINITFFLSNKEDNLVYRDVGVVSVRFSNGETHPLEKLPGASGDSALIHINNQWIANYLFSGKLPGDLHSVIIEGADGNKNEVELVERKIQLFEVG